MGSFEESLARGTAWVFLVAFGSGIATSLTPCVYPMIPITVSIFGARRSKTRAGAFVLATCYVMGIALMYATLGVLAALAGWAATGALLSSPWFVIPLSALFVALAASMFGLWEIRLPAGLQARMSSVGGAGYKGAFAMGMVGGILIAPCTGPWLAGLLGYVATTGSVALGGSLLFTYALGVGVLFWVIATFAVSLPKSGAWMDSVKSALGVALLAATLYYLQNVLAPLARYSSATTTFALINAGLLVFGAVVGGVHLSYQGTGALTRVRKTVGVLALSVGVFGLANYALAPEGKLPWIYTEKEAMKVSRAQKKPVLIDFSATWCVPCKEMEAKVLGDPAVRRELGRYVLFKVDVTNDTDRDRRLQRRYGKELPLLVLLDRRGKQQAKVGKVGPDEMLQVLRKVR